MRLLDDQQICLNFFYQEKFGNCYCVKTQSVSYRDDTFLSYCTAIGKKVKDKSGREVLLVAINMFPMPLARHVGLLKLACPLEIVSVPVRYGDNNISIEKTCLYFAMLLDRASKRSMTQTENRNMFIYYYKSAIKFSELVCELDCLDKYKDFLCLRF